MTSSQTDNMQKLVVYIVHAWTRNRDLRNGDSMRTGVQATRERRYNDRLILQSVDKNI